MIIIPCNEPSTYPKNILSSGFFIMNGWCIPAFWTISRCNRIMRIPCLQHGWFFGARPTAGLRPGLSNEAPSGHGMRGRALKTRHKSSPEGRAPARPGNSEIACLIEVPFIIRSSRSLTLRVVRENSSVVNLHAYGLCCGPCNR